MVPYQTFLAHLYRMLLSQLIFCETLLLGRWPHRFHTLFQSENILYIKSLSSPRWIYCGAGSTLSFLAGFIVARAPHALILCCISDILFRVRFWALGPILPLLLLFLFFLFLFFALFLLGHLLFLDFWRARCCAGCCKNVSVELLGGFRGLGFRGLAV